MGIISLFKILSLYYTMCWVCVLVASNIPKRKKKKQPARVFTQRVVYYEKKRSILCVFYSRF